jgi:Secretion system C-terminal sorting domain/PKD domain
LIFFAAFRRLSPPFAAFRRLSPPFAAFRRLSPPFAAFCLFFLIEQTSTAGQCPFSTQVLSTCVKDILFTSGPVGNAATFKWDFGDGAIIQGVATNSIPTKQNWHSSGLYRNVTHRYLCAGVFTISLTAFNSAGITISSCSTTLNVGNSGACANNSCNTEVANFNFNPMDFKCSRLVVRTNALGLGQLPPNTKHKWELLLDGSTTNLFSPPIGLEGTSGPFLTDVAIPVRNINTFDDPVLTVLHTVTQPGAAAVSFARYVTMPLNSIFIGSGELCGDTQFFGANQAGKKIFGFNSGTYSGIPCKNIFVTGNLIFDLINPTGSGDPIPQVSANFFRFENTNLFMGPSARLSLMSSTAEFGQNSPLFIANNVNLDIQEPCDCMWRGIEVNELTRLSINENPTDAPVKIKNAFNAIRLIKNDGLAGNNNSGGNPFGFPTLSSNRCTFEHNFIGVRSTDDLVPNIMFLNQNTFDGGADNKPLLSICNIPSCLFEWPLDSEFPFTVENKPNWFEGNEGKPHKQGYAGILIYRTGTTGQKFTLSATNSFKRMAGPIILRNTEGDISNANFEDIDVFDYTDVTLLNNQNSGNAILQMGTATKSLKQRGNGKAGTPSFKNVRRGILANVNGICPKIDIADNNMSHVQEGISVVIEGGSNIADLQIHDNNVSVSAFVMPSVTMPTNIIQNLTYNGIGVEDKDSKTGKVFIASNSLDLSYPTDLGLFIQKPLNQGATAVPVIGIDYNCVALENINSNLNRFITSNIPIVMSPNNAIGGVFMRGMNITGFNSSKIELNQIDYNNNNSNFGNNGIRVTRCKNKSVVTCNTSINLGGDPSNNAAGIGFDNCDNPQIVQNTIGGYRGCIAATMSNNASNITFNEFRVHTTSNQAIGVLYNGGSMVNTQTSKGNKWRFANGLIVQNGQPKFFLTGQSFNTGLYKMGASCKPSANLGTSIPPAFIGLGGTCPTSGIECQVPALTGGETGINELEVSIVAGNTGITKNGALLVAKQHLLKRLLDEPALEVGFSDMTIFRQTNQSGLMGQILNVRQLMSKIGQLTVVQENQLQLAVNAIDSKNVQIKQTELDLKFNPTSNTLNAQFAAQIAELVVLQQQLSLLNNQNNQQSMIDAQSVWTANELLSPAAGSIDANEKQLNKMFLEVEILKSRLLNVSDKTFLANLASICPEDGGEPIYFALSWLEAITGNVQQSVDCSAQFNGNADDRDSKLESIKGISKFVMFPNPVSDDLNIILSENNSFEQLSITDALGRTLLNQKLLIGQTNLQFNTATWNNGIYFLQLFDSISGITSKKILIQH